MRSSQKPAWLPALASWAGAGLLTLVLTVPVHANVGQTPACDFTFPPGQRLVFPQLRICAFPGAYQDSSLIYSFRCVGSFRAPLADSVRTQARTITVRFLRDRLGESRRDFGGYRVYRMTNFRDSTRMELIRRFSRQVGDERTWNFSSVDTTNNVSAPNFLCQGEVVNDSVVTFIDPDSNGNFVKVCRKVDEFGRCLSRGDSVFKLVAPPGPHDGFKTWYAITYEAKNTTADGTYEEMFVPDTSNAWAHCGTPGDPRSCPNLNNKLANVTPDPVEPTGGPTANLQHVGVVPNPFRSTEAWDTGGNELHFINLPQRATIKIYTVAGDLVVTLEHNDAVRDFARWDLKNQSGNDVASGIYMYRIEADAFTFQDRFVVIR